MLIGNRIGFCMLLVILSPSIVWATQITPYKYDEQPPNYVIPSSSRFTLKRDMPNAPDIVYYFTAPPKDRFPIAVLCGGSSTLSNVTSVIHFHRYFLQECTDLGMAVLTIEQWGVDGSKIDNKEWINHYTRTQKLKDHQQLIDFLLSNPPEGWDGNLVFIGVSEGGPIVTSLSSQYNEHTLATINWSGAGNLSWREELWIFIQKLIQDNSTCPHGFGLNDCQTCFQLLGVRKNYDTLMDTVFQNPSSHKFFLNMTYLYHADAKKFPSVEYNKLKKPFLVVAGELDSFIQSSDSFVENAKNARVPITYHRIADMDHYVRKRPDVILDSFEWLENRLKGI